MASTSKPCVIRKSSLGELSANIRFAYSTGLSGIFHRLAADRDNVRDSGVMAIGRLCELSADGGVQRTPSARQTPKQTTAKYQKMNKELLP